MSERPVVIETTEDGASGLELFKMPVVRVTTWKGLLEVGQRVLDGARDAPAPPPAPPHVTPIADALRAAEAALYGGGKTAAAVTRRRKVRKGQVYPAGTRVRVGREPRNPDGADHRNWAELGALLNGGADNDRTVLAKTWAAARKSQVSDCSSIISDMLRQGYLRAVV